MSRKGNPKTTMWPIHFTMVDDYTGRAPNGQPMSRRTVMYPVRPARTAWTARSLHATADGLHRLAGWLERRREFQLF